jgi:hypothetical protein
MMSDFTFVHGRQYPIYRQGDTFGPEEVNRTMTEPSGKPLAEYEQGLMRAADKLSEVLRARDVPIDTLRHAEYSDVKREHGVMNVRIWYAWRTILDWYDFKYNEWQNRTRAQPETPSVNDDPAFVYARAIADKIAEYER